MEPSHWGQLPHTAVVNVFSHLSHKDRAQAASTCKSWRDCYFHPSFWRRIDLELTVETGCEPARRILEKCGKYVREVCVTCTHTIAVPELLWGSQVASSARSDSTSVSPPSNLPHYRKLCQGLPKVFQALHQSEGLEKLIFSFFPLLMPCSTTQPEEEFEIKMIESLKNVILASSKLKTLALAHSVGSLKLAFLKELSEQFGKQLQVLHIPTFETVFGEAAALTSFFSGFTSLSVLTLNFSEVTEQLLKSLPKWKCAGTLRQLNVMAGFRSNLISYMSLDDSSWRQLGRCLPDLQVTLSVLISSHEESDSLLHYLTPSIPLTSLRFFVSHSYFLKEDLIDSIAKNYSNSLSCLEIHTDKSTLLFGNSSEVDPLVMLCWQCKKLKHLVITGCKLLKCNVLAIATLRGPNLSTLEVERDLLYGDQDEMWASEEYDEETPTSHDSFHSDGTFSDTPTYEAEHRLTLIQDISSSLKRSWEPVERRHMTIPKFLTEDLLIGATK